MIPDLGKYTTEVLSAYGVSIALLVVIIVLSMRRAARVRARLADVEARQNRTKDRSRV